MPFTAVPPTLVPEGQSRITGDFELLAGTRFAAINPQSPTVLALKSPPGMDGRDGSDGNDGIPGAPGTPGVAGIQGLQGIAGPPGIDGRDGNDGIDGSPGVPGQAGNTGAQGPQGIPGAPGDSGADGVDGYPGTPGVPGSPGVDGAPGLQGIPGPPGADGRDGIDGDPGQEGDPGPQGIQGVAGATGLQGIPGPPGDAGEKGDPGDQGPPGLAGTNGTNGSNGSNGSNGVAGQPGPPGDAGEKGDPGDQGPPGIAGSALPVIQPGSFLGLSNVAGAPATAIEIDGFTAAQNLLYAQTVDSTSAGAITTYPIGATDTSINFNVGIATPVLAGGTAQNGHRVTFTVSPSAASSVTFLHQSGLAVATTQWACPGAVDLILNPGDSCSFRYTGAKYRCDSVSRYNITGSANHAVTITGSEAISASTDLLLNSGGGTSIYSGAAAPASVSDTDICLNTDAGGIVLNATATANTNAPAGDIVLNASSGISVYAGATAIVTGAAAGDVVINADGGVFIGAANVTPVTDASNGDVTVLANGGVQIEAGFATPSNAAAGKALINATSGVAIKAGAAQNTAAVGVQLLSDTLLDVTAETGTRLNASPTSGNAGKLFFEQGTVPSTPATTGEALLYASTTGLSLKTPVITEQVGYLSSLNSVLIADQAITAAITNITITSYVMSANSVLARTGIRLCGSFTFLHTNVSTPTITIDVVDSTPTVLATLVMTPVAVASTYLGTIEARCVFRTTGAPGTCRITIFCQNQFGTNTFDHNGGSLNLANFTTTTANALTLRIRMTTVVAANTLTVVEGFAERFSN